MMWTRRFVPADLNAVLAMAREFHAESPVHRPHPFDDEVVTHLLEAASQSPDWLALVAYCDDGPVGFALVTAQQMFFSRDRELLDLALYVTPSHRKTRAFLKLVLAIEHWGKSAGVVKATIGINTGIEHDRTLSAFLKLRYLPTGIAVSKSVH